MTAIPHAGGLNPRAFRLAKFGRRAMRVHQKRISFCFRIFYYFFLSYIDILDGELIWKFLTLDRPKMREIALAIGADPDSIISSIKELDHAVSFF